ncbi:MAG: iron chelate uptake ABC transporter family permease subunit [Symbiopectobacterium sp.]|uniref:iron chelate uptake ABC transporter family permease subunit n=1 Tax=Symbiopectobacterium sp. TaxID=2952789 RepID=UPI003F38858A
MGPVWVLYGGVLLLIISSFASLMVGAQPIAPRVVLAAWLNPDGTQLEHILVQTTRLTRTLMSLMVGASLGRCWGADAVDDAQSTGPTGVIRHQCRGDLLYRPE